MTAKDLFRILARMVVALALGVAASTAQAALYRVGIDPLFGAPFNTLAFSGEAKIDVGNETACLASAGLFTSSTCGTLTLQSANVTLTRTTAPPGSQTFNFSTGLGVLPTGAFPPGATVLVQNTGSANEITAFDVDLIGVDIFGLGTLFPEYFGTPGNYYAGLELRTNCTGIGTSPTCTGNPEGFLLIEQQLDQSGAPIACGPNGYRDVVLGELSTVTLCRSAPGTITVTRIPEPGTLGLLLGALSAGWLIRRARQTAR